MDLQCSGNYGRRYVLLQHTVSGVAEYYSSTLYLAMDLQCPGNNCFFIESVLDQGHDIRSYIYVLMFL